MTGLATKPGIASAQIRTAVAAGVTHHVVTMTAEVAS